MAAITLPMLRGEPAGSGRVLGLGYGGPAVRSSRGQGYTASGVATYFRDRDLRSGGETMDKTELVKKLATTTGLDEKTVTQVTDSLIAEIVTPGLLETGAVATGVNNCTTNCKPPPGRAT